MVLGITQIFGYGGSRLPVTQIPQVGSVIVFRYGHVGLISAITGSILTINESNLHWDGKITYGRQIALNDPTIKGYWSP